MLLVLETEPYENVFGGEAIRQSGSWNKEKGKVARMDHGWADAKEIWGFLRSWRTFMISCRTQGVKSGSVLASSFSRWSGRISLRTSEWPNHQELFYCLSGVCDVSDKGRVEWAVLLRTRRRDLIDFGSFSQRTRDPSKPYRTLFYHSVGDGCFSIVCLHKLLCQGDRITME